MKWSLPSWTIYQKLILTFLLILLPLYTLSLSLNESGKKTVEEQITQSMQSQLHFYVMQFESEMANIIFLLQEYVNDEDLMKLSMNVEVMSDIEKVESVLRLRGKLELLTRISSYVQSVSAHIPLMNRTVSTNERYISGFDRDAFEALSVSTNRFEAPLIQWKDELYISIPFPEIAIPNKNSIRFVIDAHLSKQTISRKLSEINADRDGGAFLMMEENNWIIASGTESGRAAFIHSQLKKMRLSENKVVTISYGGVKYLVVYEKSDRLNASFVHYLPVGQVLGPIKQYKYSFWVLSIFSAMVVLVFSYQAFRWIDRPIQMLVQSFRKVENGDLAVVAPYSSRDEFHYLFDQFNEMVRKLSKLVHEVYEQQFRARSAELKHLQSQINPHFLYNSFFVLYRMVKSEDYEQVERFTRYLGEYFQYITRSANDYLPLEQEVRHAWNYCEIQQIRFAGRIRFEMEPLPPEAARLMVPRLILQPLIENVYEHGLARKTADGLLRITFHRDGGDFIIRVEDNGEHLSAALLERLRTKLETFSDAAESTGMVNIHRRIRISFGAAYGLSLARSELGGLRADLRLPLHPYEEVNQHVPDSHR